MVRIAFQDDVKKSFSKVKDDMLNIKRSLNREMLAIEELANSMQSYTSKDEFYSFIKRLGDRLDKIEANIELYTTFEDEFKDVEAKIKHLNKKLGRQEDLTAEIKEVRKLRGKLSALEGKAVDSEKLSRETAKLSGDIAAVRKAMLTDRAFDGLKKRVDAIGKSVESFGKTASSRDEVAKLQEEIAALKDSSVSVSDFSSKLKDVRKDLNTVKSELEMSVSEVDMNNYVTKKALDKKMEGVGAIDAFAKSLEREIGKFKENFASLKESSASVDDVEKIGKDVAGIAKSIDGMKESIEGSAEKSQKRLDDSIKKLGDKFAKDLAKAKSDYDEKLKKVRKERGVSPKKGLITRVGRGVSDFFREEEEAEEKSPLPEEKKGERKKEGKDEGNNASLLISALVLIAVLAGGIFYFSGIAGQDESGLEEAVGDAAEELRDRESAASEDGLDSGSPDVSAPEDARKAEGEPAAESVDSSEAEDAAGGVEGVADTLVDDSAEVSSEDVVVSPIEECRERYECKERADGEYWFNCYIDNAGECRCFTTRDASKCGIAGEEAEEVVEMDSGEGAGASGYLIAVGAVLVVVLLAYYYSLRTSGNSKKGKKQDKKEGEGNGVDLEEFFQKK